jgi:hypothetical protein
MQLWKTGGNLKCVDWADVGGMAVAGAVLPGLAGAAGKALKSGKAALEINSQIKRVKAVSRINKLTGRLNRHTSIIKSQIKTQGGLLRQSITIKTMWTIHCAM